MIVVSFFHFESAQGAKYREYGTNRLTDTMPGTVACTRLMAIGLVFIRCYVRVTVVVVVFFSVVVFLKESSVQYF